MRSFLAIAKSKIQREYYPLFTKGVHLVPGEDPGESEVLSVKCDIDGANYFSQLGLILPWFSYAEKKGWRVAIESTTNSEGIWDSVWLQPSNMDPEQAKKIRHYETDIALCISQNPYVLSSGSEQQYWNRLCKKYLHLSEQAEQFVNARINQIPDLSRTIGVICRGTDYVNMRPKDHPIQPTAEMLIEKVNDVMRTTGNEYVFLATEDQAIAEKLSNAFGDKLILTSRNFVQYNTDTITSINDYDLIHRLDSIYSYIANIYTVAQCNSIVAGVASGTMGAMCLSEGYNAKYLFNLGKY